MRKDDRRVIREAAAEMTAAASDLAAGLKELRKFLNAWLARYEGVLQVDRVGLRQLLNEVMVRKIKRPRKQR